MRIFYVQSQRNATQRNATQRNATQRNATQRNATQRNATQRNAPRISFIIPIYNAEIYLPYAIESVLFHQIEKEIILVDDGSTDNSLSIALNYARQYEFISVIFSQNKGVSAARNKGLRAAQGEFVLFLDADDCLDKLFAWQKLDTHFLHHKHIDIVKGLYHEQSRDTPEIPMYVHGSLFSCESKEKYGTFSDLLSLMVHYCHFPQIGTFLFRRAFLIENQLFFNEDLSYAEDILFLTQVTMLKTQAQEPQDNIVEIPHVIVHYRHHEKSTLSTLKESDMAASLAIAIKEVVALSHQFEQTEQFIYIKMLYLHLMISLFYLLQDNVNQQDYAMFNFPQLVPLIDDVIENNPTLLPFWKERFASFLEDLSQSKS